MEGDLKGALEAYLHADLLNSESKSVIRRIAGCYRSLKQPEEALKYYRRYEALNPDNLSVQISIGHCHLELKDYNEALKCFFKVDYLDSKSHKAWRPIAWCSFLTGKYDQARNYYKKILDNQPNAQDLLNTGVPEMSIAEYIKGALSLLPASGTNGKRQLPQVPGTVQPRRSRPTDRRYRRNRSSSDAGSAKI